MERGTGTIAAPTAGRSTAESSPPPADVLGGLRSGARS